MTGRAQTPDAGSITDTAPVDPRRATAGALAEIVAAFLKLGCLSFGGPIAHLGYLRAEIVEQRKWIDDAHFSDLVALCQFLPGSASSQVVFALGMQRAGIFGGIVASACFTLPLAAIMIGGERSAVRPDECAERRSRDETHRRGARVCWSRRRRAHGRAGRCASGDPSPM